MNDEYYDSEKCRNCYHYVFTSHREYCKAYQVALELIDVSKCTRFRKKRKE